MSNNLLEQHLIKLLESGVRIPYTNDGLILLIDEIKEFSNTHTLNVRYKRIELPYWKRLVNHISPLFKEEYETVTEWVKNA